MSNDLFATEKQILEQAEQHLQAEDLTPEAFSTLLKGYEKLLKRTRRLIKMSDRSEAEIRRLSDEQSLLNATLSDQNEKLESLSVKLSKYLSPQVYESIFTGKAEVRVGADRKFLTVFFSDIASFTEITDQLEPEILTRSLNAYLNEMAQIAISHGATIDKYIGDAVMAFFGDPETDGPQQDATRCVAMAMEMQSKTDQLNATLRTMGVSRPFRIRCGINSGICTVGNFGSENRLDYTAIGNHVNLASRLESAAKLGEVLISEETMLLVQDHFNCVPKEVIQVKGFARPIQTYVVQESIEQDRTQALTLHAPGLDLEIDPSQLSPEVSAALQDLLRQARHLVANSTENRN